MRYIFSLCVSFLFREGQYRYKTGTTAVLTKTVTPLSLDVVNESVQIMDTEWNSTTFFSWNKMYSVEKDELKKTLLNDWCSQIYLVTTAEKYWKMVTISFSY